MIKIQRPRVLSVGIKRLLSIGVLSLISSMLVALPKDGMLKASYVQLDAVGSLAMITPEGIAASNIIVFAFADANASTPKAGYIDSIRSIVAQEAPNTVNLMSLGGQTVTSIANPTQAISNVDLQIKSINANLPSDKKITGVDLDLENAIPADTILQLAKGFKANN